MSSVPQKADKRNLSLSVIFIHENVFEIVFRQNGGHFAQGEMS